MYFCERLHRTRSEPSSLSIPSPSHNAADLNAFGEVMAYLSTAYAPTHAFSSQAFKGNHKALLQHQLNSLLGFHAFKSPFYAKSISAAFSNDMRQVTFLPVSVPSKTNVFPLLPALVSCLRRYPLKHGVLML